MKTVKLKLTIEELQFLSDSLVFLLNSSKPENLTGKLILSTIAELVLKIQKRTFIFINNKKTVSFSLKLSEAYAFRCVEKSYTFTPSTWEWNTYNIILNEIKKQTA
jgi:hypothetical protein